MVNEIAIYRATQVQDTNGVMVIGLVVALMLFTTFLLSNRS